MKDLKYLQLFDAYGPLLTEHQRDVCELYYMCDLSLTEIAEQKGVSKQSVSDTLAKSRQLLDGYEQKLRVVATAGALEEAERKLSAFAERHPEFFSEIKEIASVLNGADADNKKDEE